MPRKIEILNELKEISPLLYKIESENLFSVPSQYFETLPSRILTTIRNPNLSGEEDKQFNFSNIPPVSQDVPENYFAGLSHNIIANIRKNEINEELKEFSLLAALKGKNVFTVPQGYFENKPGEIIEEISTNKIANVVSINRGKVISMNSTWWKTAAAAVIAGVVAISSYFFISNPESQSQSNYLTSQSQYKTPEQVNVAIASLSDDEIANYLEDHGNILDNEQLIKDVSTEGMPEVEDYLLDDNTLNNYLKEIGANEAQKLN